MTVPRRLEINLNIDFTSEAHRKLHATRIFNAAEVAIEAALDKLRGALLDSEISATVASEVNWGYAWNSRSASQRITHDGSVVEADDEDDVPEDAAPEAL